MMNKFNELLQYIRNSVRTDTGGLSNAYALAIEADKEQQKLADEMQSLKDKIASQANMIAKLQVKAGHVDLLRESVEQLARESVSYQVFIDQEHGQSRDEDELRADCCISDEVLMADSALRLANGGEG